MKFFVCSDVHSAYTPWMVALDEAGFDVNNKEHKIIVCGDLFDRCNESQKTYKFMRDMIDRDKIIYVKGNHEQLLLDCCERGYPCSHDMSNGTARTIWDLGYGTEFYDCCEYVLAKIKPFMNSMVNYYETKHYIFVHSWIPTIEEGSVLKFNPDWRKASQEEWDQAMWGNPFNMAIKGLNQTGKIIVCGHWHTSYLRTHFEGKPEWGKDADFSPYYYEDKLIGIDSCVAYTGKLNCLVLEDKI